MDIGLKVQELRIKAGINKATDLAKLADLPQQTISDLERGKVKNPGIYTIEKVCKALGITLSDFFSDEDTAQVLPQFERELIQYSKDLPNKQREAILQLLKAINEE